MERRGQDRRRASHTPLGEPDAAPPLPTERPRAGSEPAAPPEAEPFETPADGVQPQSEEIEPPASPDGTFIKVDPEDHPLPGACEVTVYFQDYHRSSSKLGRFGKIVGMDRDGAEYLVMLDNFECVSAPMRRVEWRKVAT